MGFFSKLKANFNHGGLNISMQAPHQARFTDPLIPISATLSAEQNLQVNKLTVSLEMRPKDINDHNRPPKTYCSIDLPAPFNMVAGESKQLQVDLPLAVPEMPAANTEGVPQGFLNAVSMVASIGNKLEAFGLGDNEKYEFSLRVWADVEGVSFDPSCTSNIMMLQANQFGTTIGGVNIRI